MKIQYASDLHMDMGHQPNWKENNTIIPSADILVLAGDIYRASLTPNNEFFDWLSKNFKKVYWLPGNHEFYNGVNVNNFIDICHPVKENVFFINNKSITFEEDDTTLFFTTLWTKLNPFKAHLVQRGMNDFYKIKVDGQVLNVGLYDYLHTKHIEWLTNELKNNKSKNKVVITHHCPSFQCEDPKYKESSITSGFITNLDQYIFDNDIKYWIYGHTHYNVPEITIKNTKLLTNQFCYQFANEGIGYLNNKVLDI